MKTILEAKIVRFKESSGKPEYKVVLMVHETPGKVMTVDSTEYTKKAAWALNRLGAKVFNLDLSKWDEG